MAVKTLTINDGIVEGELFLVPNAIHRWGSYFDPELKEDYKSICEENNLPCNDDTEFVEIWVSNSQASDWNSVYVILPDRGLTDTPWFPSRLPVELFDGKVEGDIVEFSIKGQKVRVKLCQLGHRYGDYRFEEYLQNIKEGKNLSYWYNMVNNPV